MSIPGSSAKLEEIPWKILALKFKKFHSQRMDLQQRDLRFTFSKQFFLERQLRRFLKVSSALRSNTFPNCAAPMFVFLRLFASCFEATGFFPGNGRIGDMKPETFGAKSWMWRFPLRIPIYTISANRWWVVAFFLSHQVFFWRSNEIFEIFGFRRLTPGDLKGCFPSLVCFIFARLEALLKSMCFWRVWVHCIFSCHLQPVLRTGLHLCLKQLPAFQF